MPSQTWFVYIGAITGVVGCLTGIAGAVLAYLAFRRSGNLKSLDLRMELRRTLAVLQSDSSDLEPLLRSAKGSRSALAAARGYRDGAMVAWLKQWETDAEHARELVATAASYNVDLSAFTQGQLEQHFSSVHKLQLQIGKLTAKYQASLSADNAGRTQLAADQRAAMQARMEGKI